MGDDILEDNEVLVRSTNALGSFLRRIQMCTGKSSIDPESVPKLAWILLQDNVIVHTIFSLLSRMLTSFINIYTLYKYLIFEAFAYFSF